MSRPTLAEFVGGAALLLAIALLTWLALILTTPIN